MKNNKRICPFCGKPITSKYFWKYDDWSCGCFNKDCKIGPKTNCKKTKEEAEMEWESAYVE